MTVSVTVTNTGNRRGAEVVQCYVGHRDARVVRPPKELKAFEKVWLDPGETTTVSLNLDQRAFAYWDPGNRYKGPLMPDPAGNFATTPDAEPGWRVDPGTYQISIGRAADDIRHVIEVEVSA
jgi:beta-glucosidase